MPSYTPNVKKPSKAILTLLYILKALLIFSFAALIGAGLFFLVLAAPVVFFCLLGISGVFSLGVLGYTAFKTSLFTKKIGPSQVNSTLVNAVVKEQKPSPVAVENKKSVSDSNRILKDAIQDFLQQKILDGPSTSPIPNKENILSIYLAHFEEIKNNIQKYSKLYFDPDNLPSDKYFEKIITIRGKNGVVFNLTPLIDFIITKLANQEAPSKLAPKQEPERIQENKGFDALLMTYGLFKPYTETVHQAATQKTYHQRSAYTK